MLTKMSEIVEVLQHDSVAGEIITALMHEIEDLEKSMLDEQADFKASMELALSVALEPSYIAEIAAERSNKVLAIKKFREHARYGSSPNTQNQIGLKDAKEFVEAIWRVRDEATEKMWRIANHVE